MEKQLMCDPLIGIYQDIIITDQRDIDEINRRKKAKTFHPPKNELYSVNPDFDGQYTL